MPLRLSRNERRYLYSEGKSISIFATTWNLGGKHPNEKQLRQWLQHSELFAVIVIGTQECGHEASIISRPSMHAEYHDLLVRFLDRTHTCISYAYLGSTVLHCFLMKRIEHSFKKRQEIKVMRGSGGMFANKGAVALQFELIDESQRPWACLRFINAHFTSDEGKVKARDDDYAEINRQLNRRFKSNEALEVNTLWMGDLNYRINAPRACVLTRMKKTRGMMGLLRPCDELTQEKDAGAIFDGYTEEEISFEPTYKKKIYSGHKATDEYASNRTPSWTDRILYKCPSFRRIDNLIDRASGSAVGYESITGLHLSDHDPVVLGLIMSEFQAKRPRSHSRRTQR